MPFFEWRGDLVNSLGFSGAERAGAEHRGGLINVRCLICRIGARTCALPLEHVVEIMRPLPLERFEPAPQFVLGVSIIRGTPLVVVDAGELLEQQRISLARGSPRFVVLRAGAHQAALAVSEVAGVAALAASGFTPLPGLLAEQTALVQQLGSLDGRLLEVLQSARIVERAVISQPAGASS